MTSKHSPPSSIDEESVEDDDDDDDEEFEINNWPEITKEDLCKYYKLISENRVS